MTYLLSNHTDVPMQATADKEPSTFDLEQLFEQYVDTGLFQRLSSEDATPDQSSSDDLAHLFDVPSSNGSIPLKPSTLPNWDTSIHGTSWHKAVYSQQKQNLASPDLGFLSSSTYPESSGKACLSDSDLLSFDDLFELNDTEPRANPHSHSSQTTTHTPRITRTSSLDRLARHGVKKTRRKPFSLSSNLDKMMSPSHYRTEFQDIWTRKIDAAPESFSLQIPSNGFRSSSPPSVGMREESGNQFLPRDTQNYALALSPALYGEATSTPELLTSNYQLTPLSSPAIDMNSKMSNGENAFQVSGEGVGSAYMSQHFPSAALSALQTPPPTQRLPMGVWGADTAPNLDFGNFTSTSADFATEDSAKDDAWWSAASSSMPPPNGNHHQDTFTASRSHTSRNIEGLSSSSVAAGLGISCDTASFTGFGGDLATSTNNNHATSSVDAASSFDMTTYSTPHLPHLYHAPPSPGIPIGTGPARPPSPSNSPSSSPRPLFTRRRHSQLPSSQHQPHHTHTRRKSSTNASSLGHRNGSASSSPGNPGGSTTASASTSSGSVGFVNFTPSDSRKILTGVAPSGSSKTKARREKEAAEKRRKLSQAAVKAVIEAGGDLGKLEKEGLLALEG